MKRVIFMLSVVLMVAALLVSPGALAESLGQIMDRYNTCDSNYNYNMNHYPSYESDCRWGGFYPTQCVFAPDPDACAEGVRTQCLQSAFSNYSSCVSDIGPHRDAENFCDHAREVRDYCNAAYSQLEDYDAWSSCMASSGIEQCE